MVTTVYNEEVKKQFIEEKTSETQETQKTFKSLFEVTEPIENKYGEDLCLIPMETAAKELLQTGKIGAFSSFKTSARVLGVSARLLIRSGFCAFSGRYHVFPFSTAPWIFPLAQYPRTLRSDTPHFFAVSATER